jgi:hypothetical protein
MGIMGACNGVSQNGKELSCFLKAETLLTKRVTASIQGKHPNQLFSYV